MTSLKIMEANMKIKLTEKQAIVYRAVCDWWKVHNYPPTIREITDMTQFGFGSTRWHLDKLKEKELVEWEENIMRSIRPVHMSVNIELEV